jgi:lipopolysaccharide export system protein LptA
VNIPHFSVFLIIPFLGFSGVALAEKADRNKPMNIEADALRYDDLKQVSVFTGRVVLTKGSIQIRGHQIEVRQDPDGFQFGLVTGSPGTRAFFRQKREGIEEFIEGEGETIEYDSKPDTVKFIKKAELRRLRGTTLGDEITGNVILYENLTDMFSVDGAPKGGAGVAGAGNASQGGRVRAMLTPKPAATGATPAAQSANASPTLRATAVLPGAPQ